jgi:hypothetical protein
VQDSDGSGPLGSPGLHEEPRLFFVHFWGVGDAEELSGGLRAALDQTKSG